MDTNTRQRRQDQASSSSSNTRYSTTDSSASRRSYGAGGLDRYRPAPISTTPPGPRSMSGVPAYSAYYQEPSAAFSQPMAQNSMAYTPEYAQDSRQTQGYGAYGSNMLYNVPQAGAQGSVYETNQQFPSRQGAGLQMLPTDVTAPYFPSESANAATAAGLQPEQRMLQQGYTSTMAPMGGIAQTGAPEQVAEDQEYSPAVHAAPSTSTAEQAQMGEAYEQYQAALRNIFTDIHAGSLQSAGVALMGVSEWLLTKVVELGTSVSVLLIAFFMWLMIDSRSYSRQRRPSSRSDQAVAGFQLRLACPRSKTKRSTRIQPPATAGPESDREGAIEKDGR